MYSGGTCLAQPLLPLEELAQGMRDSGPPHFHAGPSTLQRFCWSLLVPFPMRGACGVSRQS